MVGVEPRVGHESGRSFQYTKVHDPTNPSCNNAERETKLLKAVSEFHHSIEVNQAFIPNYGDRYRHGEAISSAFVESTVNQVISKRMVKKQQMRWTQRGAHLLLQVRTQVLNDDLRRTFERWYPGLKTDIVPTQEAAA